MKYTAPVAAKIEIESVKVLLTSGEYCPIFNCGDNNMLPPTPCEDDD